MRLNKPGGVHAKNGKKGGSESIFLDDEKFDIHRGEVRIEPEYFKSIVMPYVRENDTLRRRIDELKAQIEKSPPPPMPLSKERQSIYDNFVMDPPTLWERFCLMFCRPFVVSEHGVQECVYKEFRGRFYFVKFREVER